MPDPTPMERALRGRSKGQDSVWAAAEGWAFFSFFCFFVGLFIIYFRYSIENSVTWLGGPATTIRCSGSGSGSAGRSWDPALRSTAPPAAVMATPAAGCAPHMESGEWSCEISDCSPRCEPPRLAPMPPPPPPPPPPHVPVAGSIRRWHPAIWTRSSSLSSPSLEESKSNQVRSIPPPPPPPQSPQRAPVGPIRLPHLPRASVWCTLGRCVCRLPCGPHDGPHGPGPRPIQCHHFQHVDRAGRWGRSRPTG